MFYLSRFHLPGTSIMGIYFVLFNTLVLQNVVKEQAADQMMAHGRAKEVMKGWLIKVYT